MTQLKLLFSLMIFGWIAGCSGNSFDRSQILEHAANDLIIPAYADFEAKVDSLHKSIVAFTENPDTESLELAQEAWTSAIKSWKRAEVYNFGPAEDMVLVTAIDRWPTSGAGIETAIEEYDGSDDYLVRIGSNRKGLPAVEYLLFHETPKAIIVAFSDPNRKEYLKLLSRSLADNSRRILESWQNEYKQSFIEATGNRPSSGITLLANEMSYLLGMIKMDKIDIPFGSQTMGTARLQMLESPYAEISKDLIRENLEAARRAFTGGEGAGFDDYLDALNILTDEGELLSEKINREFDNAIHALDDIEGSLKDAIQNDKEKVEALSESVKRVSVLIEVDMMSRLGILSVYSDNDGD